MKTKSYFYTLLSGVVCFLIASSSMHAGEKFIMQIEGSKLFNSLTKIQCISVKQGIASPRDAASGQASGKRMHKPFVITKEFDKASPMLAKIVASGELLPAVNLVFAGDLNGDGREDLYKVTLHDVMISAISSSSGGDRPTESLSLNFTKIEFKNKEMSDKEFFSKAFVIPHVLESQGSIGK